MNSTPQVKNIDEKMPFGRGQGTTTRLAVSFLNKALNSPGVPIEVHDHHNTLVAHVRLAHTVSSLLDALNVEHIVNGNCVMVHKLPQKGQAA